jgi:Domain of unknown function (DUF5655)
MRNSACRADPQDQTGSLNRECHIGKEDRASRGLSISFEHAVHALTISVGCLGKVVDSVSISNRSVLGLSPHSHRCPMVDSSAFALYYTFMSWACPRCGRSFRQINQRHACGVGSAATLLKDRPPALADLYRKLEATVRGFGEVEVVTRDRYALFRTTRIFADLTVMREALRVVIHLGRKARAPYFIKIGSSNKRVSHVAVVRTGEDLRAVLPFLREAFDLAASEES